MLPPVYIPVLLSSPHFLCHHRSAGATVSSTTGTASQLVSAPSLLPPPPSSNPPSTSRLKSSENKSNHVTSLVKLFQWLSTVLRIKCKLLTTAYKILHRQSPSISNFTSYHSLPHPLCSSHAGLNHALFSSISGPQNILSPPSGHSRHSSYD